MVFQHSHEICSLVREHHVPKGSRAAVSNCLLGVSMSLREKAAAHGEATARWLLKTKSIRWDTGDGPTPWPWLPVCGATSLAASVGSHRV